MKKEKAYAAAGVDVDLGNRLKRRIPALVKQTHRPEVLGKIGGFEYNTSLVFERGHLATDRVDAWGGGWLVGYTFAGVRGTPRLAVEYNYATGDGDPHDGRRNTFQLLYPTRHDLLSLSDQVGCIRNVAR